MIKAVVHSQADDVDRRLARLGLEQEQLLHAARRLAFLMVKLHAQPSASWDRNIRMDRSRGCPSRSAPTTRMDSFRRANYALVFDPEGSMAINVATGDAGTGRIDAVPSNKAPKGVSTADAISVNQQQLELDLPVPNMPHIYGEDGPMTWFLLLHRSDKEIRSELSLPSAMSPDGRITRWQERIILSPIPLDPEIEIQPPQGIDLDIEVTRKA